MSIKKKLATLSIICLSTICLSGCGSSLVNYVRTSYPNDVKARAEANKDIAADLNRAGYISDDLYARLCKQIDSATTRALAKVDKEANADVDEVNIDAVSGLAEAVSNVQLHHPQFVEKIGDNGEDTGIQSAKDLEFLGDATDLNPGNYSSYVLSNYLYGSYAGKRVEETDDVYIKWQKMECKTPIDFFGNCSEELETALNEKFRLPVYVLDAEKINRSDKSMDEVLASIQTAVEGENINGLTQYFSELKDSNGESVTLMDSDFKITGFSKENTDGKQNKPGYDLMMYQELQYAECDGSCIYYDEHGGRHDSCDTCDTGCGSARGLKKGNVACGSFNDGNGGCESTQCAMPEKVQVATLRFNEFDSDKVNELKEMINSNEKSYYFQVGANGTPAAYLLEYPVSVLDTFRASSKNNHKIVGTLTTESGMGINIGTGKLVIYDEKENGEFKLNGKTVEATDTYLTTSFGNKDGKTGLSSFVAKGVTTVTIKAGGRKIKVLAPQIVLRDYLEATWAPGSTEYKENLVAFGRKIRFRTENSFWRRAKTISTASGDMYQYELMYNTDNADNCAFFVDIDGKEVGSLTKLYITDMCDVTALAKGYKSKETKDNKWVKYLVKHFPEATEQTVTKDCIAKNDETTPDIKELAETTDIKKLKASIMFPGECIDTVDYEDNNNGTKMQRFYCVVTRKGMFDSALFSDWINSTASNASLEWWNSYLSEHDYKYVIGHDKVNEYLQTNYKYELSQSDAIILDLNTVSKIQQMYDKEADVQSNKLIRTFFYLMGLTLVAYAMILMLCWVIDTQADLGLSLVNKLTFGKWTAIAYDDEVPSYNKDQEHMYVGCKQMILRCLIIIAIAILLIQIDVTRVVYVLIRSFGRAATYIEKMIKGTVG